VITALLIGGVVSIVLAITRSRDDADKPVGSYVVKTMIVVCPVIFLSLMVLNQNSGLSGGSGCAAACAPLQMHTGVPDF